MITRRLAAILVADVVGYSKLVGADEAATLAQLQALRRDVIEPAIARHSGRLFKAVGDGFLVEFASAVQAVTAARAIQESNAGGGLPLRIGIHVGDVIVEGDDLMGDGVNIASRIEGLADAGGIALSRQVHDLVRDRLDLACIDKGEVTLKNIARPVHVFAVTGSNPSASAPTLALPDKPSIAVLPFQNMSGDPEQEYFADGMVEDIITALSRFKSLFVIARNSSFTYKGRAVDIKQVGRELGVRYVLEGSVRKAGKQLRITGQLIEAATGAHLWADRFDGSLEDVFQLQDQVTTSVVGAIAPRVDKAEMARAFRKPVENLDSYDCFLRGLAQSSVMTKESSEEALRLFYRAIELDPEFATPYGLAARCYQNRVDQGWVVDREWEMAEIRRLAAKVAAIGRDDALALATAGMALVRVCHDHEAGEELLDQAIANNPNMAVCWRLRAFASLFAGQHEAAIDQAARSLRLSPVDPLIDRTELVMASALLLLGRHEEALEWAKRSHRHDPNSAMSLRALAITNVYAGRSAEAQLAMAALRQMDPTLTFARIEAALPYRRPVDRAKWIEGIRRAGLPEDPKPTLALPDKPSIAVLPFQNMSGDPEQEYFADGMVEDIITALSGFKSLFVIARNSSFSYKGKSPDIRQVGRELGVRYVLEGSVRKAGQRVRITGQLINCENGAHLWADRFDSALEDIFDLQDRVTASVVAAIAPRLDHAERERARRKPVESLDAYDCFLRGMACSHEWTPAAWEKARDLFYRAIELDPGFSTPYGMAARCYAARQALGSVVDAEWEKAEIRRLASRVSAIGRDDALALCWAGYAMVYVCREYEVGAALTDQALAINPNLAAGWTNRGVISSFLGQYETAIRQLTEALRLNPRDPESFRPESFIAVAHFILGRYDQALVWAARSQASQSTWMPALRVSAVANALTGNIDEARTLVARMLGQDPGMRISNLRKYLAYRDTEAIDLFARGLRIAGMPE